MLLVIQFILLRTDLSIFVASDKHFRISDMALLYEFMHKVLLLKRNMQLNYQTTSTYQKHGVENVKCFGYSTVIENDSQD
jgi:hypothetical protein